MPQISIDNNNQPTTPANNITWKPEEVPQLTVDVYRKGETIFIVSTVAGVVHTDLDITIENNTLSIKGFRKKPYDSNDAEVLLEECVWGEFYRELTINENLDVNLIKASIAQGILTIEIPILKLVAHRRIAVDFVSQENMNSNQ
jgi:HSP20 family protein